MFQCVMISEKKSVTDACECHLIVHFSMMIVNDKKTKRS